MSIQTMNAKSTSDTSRWFSKQWWLEQKALIALLILIAVVSALNPNFFTTDNLLNILRQTSVNAIMAVGMGRTGVMSMLSYYIKELEQTLRVCGLKSLNDITPRHITKFI